MAKISQNKKNVLEYGEKIYKEYVKRNDTKRSQKSGGSLGERIYKEYSAKSASEDLMSYAKEYTRTPLNTSSKNDIMNPKKQLQNMVEEYKKRVGNKTQTISGAIIPDEKRIGGYYHSEIKADPKFEEYKETAKKKYMSAEQQANYPGRKNITSMSPEESDIYDYLIGKDGQKLADEFRSRINFDLNQRMTESEKEKYKGISKKYPVAGVGINAAASLGSGAGYIDAAKNAVIKKKTDTNSEAFLPSAIEEASREGVKEAARDTFGDNETVDFLTDTGLSITQNIARLPFGSVGLAVAAGGAATGGYKDAIERGGTESQALLSGAAQGGAEAFYEKYSLESLKGLQAVPVKVKSDIVKNLLKQGFTESSEEIFTELANYMSDELIMKERSEYNQNLKAYQEAGYSYDDAVRKANQDLLKQIGLAGAGGALSGGIMGGGAMALGQAQQSTDNKYLNQLIVDPADPTQSGSREDIWRAEFAKEYAKELAQENTKEFAQGNNPQEQPEPAQIRFENEQAEDLQPTKEKTAETARELSKEIFASYGENGSRVATEQYNPELELLDYQRAFNKYYDAGRHNNTMKAAENAPITAILSKEQAQAAYNAGLEDFKLEQSQEFEYKQGEEKKGSFINQAEHSTGAQVKFLEKVGKQTGLKVVLVDDMEGANASYENGTITISANSKNVMGSTSHELTHFMREYAKKDFESYRDMCVNYMMESKNVSLDKLVENYQKSYEKQGQTLTRDEIMEEITADATVEFFNDEAFIERVVKKDRSIGERIMDFLNDIIDAMKELISSETRAASRAIKENMQHYEMLREVWGEALGIASDTYKSGKELVEKQEKKYQLKKPELATEEQIEKNFETVRKMKPVAELTGNEFEGRRGVKSLTEAVTEYYNSLGNVVHNDVVGDIVLSRRSAKDDIAHGYNDLKAVAFKSVPDVLEKGQILNYSKNWKERGYDTAIIGAKVKISSGKNKGNYYQICVAKVSKENRMYLHEVQITKMNGSNPFKTWTAKSGLPSGDAPFIYSIFDKLQGVNDKTTRFQLKDSDGNTLSDGQKEYFKDSKVRDEKGNLMVMYHGTPNAGFTEFRPGTYFTPNEWYAEFYHDTGASMLKTKQTADNPDTYKVYLNMKKPFDTRLPEVREIWDNDFYMQWGSGTPLMESGLPDWVDGEDILEFIEENELDFDGVILDEGGIYEDGEVKKRGLSYVVMSPEQVKNVTNQNPTENKDIRYQLEEIDESLNTDDIIKENEKLKEANEELRQQLTLTRKYAPRIEDINKYAGEILKTYNSDYSKKALADNLERLYRYMGNEKVNMDEISEVSAILAKNVLNKAHSADLENEEYNKKLLNTIRETKMKIPRELRPDLVIEGGYGVFRQKYFRKLTLSEKGIGIDVAYEQLKTQYPELFPEGIINPIDQLFKIAEVVDEAKPKIENPYKADLDELSVILGQEMLDYRVNIRNRPKTEADKLFERADELEGKWYTSRKLYEEKMKNYKATLKAQEETKSAKKQIIRDVTKMQDWLLRPNDKEHVPEALRVPVAQFLSQIDYSTSYKNQFGEETKRTLSWEAAKSAFESIMSSGCVVEGKYYELDPNLAVNIEKLTEKVKGMNRLDELDHDTIVTLRDTVVSMKKSIVEADLLHGNESYVQAGKAAKQCAEELKTRKDKWTAKGFGRTDELLNVDMLDSFTFFETMGPAAETMLRELRSGFDKKVEYKRATADYFEKLKEENKLTAKQMREWSKDTREFTGENGTIRLTTGELMTLYGLTKRPQARKHIFESGARGIRTRSSEEVREVKVGDKTVMKVKGTGSTKPVQFTANEVSEMVKTLTPEQKNIVDGIMKYFVDYTGKWGNEVSMLMYGYKKFNDQNYFPIEVDRNELAVTTEAQQQTRTMLKNLGMTKSTVKDAKNAIIIDDIFNVFAKHADQMENYAALTPALSDFHKFYNYKDENFNGLKELIEQKLGKEGNSYIQDLLIDVNGGMSKESSPTAAMLRNVKSAAVGANIRTVIQQPTAYMRAMMEIDPKYLALGLKKAPKGAWEECKKYAAIAQWKDWGFFDINTGRSMRSIMMGPETLRESMIEKSMEAAGKGDEIAWTHLWLAVQEETKSIHPDLTGEEFYKYCGRRFSDIIDRTQVVDSIFHRSRAMKKKTLDIYTSFMSEPTKSYNMLYRAADKMKRGNTKEARKYLERAALTYTLTGALTSVAAAVWDAFRDDDDEKGLAEKYKENLLSNLLDNLNPLNLIPFVKDVVSIFSGYALNRMDMQGIQYAKYSLTELQNYIEGTSKFNFAGMMGKWTKPVSMLTGVPASNLIREINTIFDAAFAIGKEAGLEGAHIADYKKDTLTLPLEKEKNLTNYTKKALKAYSEGKRAAGDRILEELKKSGIAQNKIDSKIKIVMKDWPDVEEAAEKFLEGDLEGYESAVNELSEYGIDKELIISSVHSAINKIQKADEESEEEQEEEQEEEKEDEKKGEPILYKGKDIYYALESGNEKNANKMIDHIYKAKRKAGKKASTARGAIKSSLSSQYKKIYLNSGHEERLKIRRKLEKIRVDGQAIFKESDFKNWLEKK